MQKKISLLILPLALIVQALFAQTVDSTKMIHHFSGSISITNNGISVIPTFSLGKPAAVLVLSAGRRKLSFEPELRFALEGKPWSFVFWWRYKLWNTSKFKMHVGVHPALNFRYEMVPVNGVLQEATIARRYLATELSPSYALTKNISVGTYYLFSRGLDAGTIGTTHFITVNSTFSNIRLTRQLRLRLMPQLYYLQMDKEDGFFFTSAMHIAKPSFPISLSATINKRIQSNIATSKDFIWSASLVYSFQKRFVKQSTSP